MTLAPTAGDGAVLTLACSVIALVTRALTPGGVIAGGIIGLCVSAAFGLPGLAVLGTFFVVGTLATRIGYRRKAERGAAEANEGRRDWRRVVGKGGVAAAVALWFVATGRSPIGSGNAAAMFAGAVSAALADTLGTEIGTLWPGQPKSVPWFRPVPAGTPGAMSNWGTAATIAGGAIIATVAWMSGVLRADAQAWLVLAAGPLASVVESMSVGLGLRAPGFIRNVLTTLVGALGASVMSVVR